MASDALTLSDLINAFDKHWEAEVAAGIEERFNMMERLTIGVFAQWVAEEYDITPKRRDPIASAVRAELQPLEDALIDAGHKLAKDGEA